MRIPASEKLEIICLVEQSHLPARRTLQTLGVEPSTFYRWYDRFQSGGPEALEDKLSIPKQVWNRIPDHVRERIVTMALELPELSPRELATRFTDTEGYFVWEDSVYRAAQIARSHHQSDLRGDKGGRGVQGQEHSHKPAVANRLWRSVLPRLKFSAREFGAIMAIPCNALRAYRTLSFDPNTLPAIVNRIAIRT